MGYETREEEEAPRVQEVILNDVKTLKDSPLILEEFEDVLHLLVPKDRGYGTPDNTIVPLEPLVKFLGPFFDLAMCDHPVIMQMLKNLVEEADGQDVSTEAIDWRPDVDSVEISENTPEQIAMMRAALVLKISKFNEAFPESFIALPEVIDVSAVAWLG